MKKGSVVESFIAGGPVVCRAGLSRRALLHRGFRDPLLLSLVRFGLPGLVLAGGIRPAAGEPSTPATPAGTAPPQRALANVRPIIEEPFTAGGLHGTLTRPRTGPAHGLAVLIIPGSGPTDRDGNGPGLATHLYRLMAHELAAAGYPTLRYDKRGIGASRAQALPEADMRFPQAVDDAGLLLAALRNRADIAGVVPLGHSEGALVAMLLARRTAVPGLILVAPPGRPLRDLLKAQLAASGLPADLATQADAIVTELAAGRSVADVPPALMAAFRPSVQPYLISQISIDPARELAQIGAPTLLIGAGRDLQVAEADVAALAAARPDAPVARLAEANHVFKAAPPDRAGNLALYADPAAPLDPGLMPVLLDFLAGLPEAAPRRR